MSKLDKQHREYLQTPPDAPENKVGRGPPVKESSEQDAIRPGINDPRLMPIGKPGIRVREGKR
ncbi:hypothetical protein FHT87_000621 [Rhizobium sp. BK316]|uniref:hypothetical protein n=1 Tax=Rhizobium sp. BK316 TaxID=2587053 RepID=UPI0016169AB6|nr:hypothetical protein [Rhizobium sp. BK316]MBB3406721.1 hypothetical protein [Rhizobium sp. BK316]